MNAINTSKFELKIATTEDEKQQAYGVRYQAYLNAGYISENPSQQVVDEFDTMPQTSIVVVKLGNQVVGTRRLTIDSEVGLPMDFYGYGQYLAPYRKKKENC